SSAPGWRRAFARCCPPSLRALDLDLVRQLAELVVPVSQAAVAHDDDAESRLRSLAERHADRPGGCHLHVARARTRVAMVVPGEQILHAGVAEQRQMQPASLERNVEV